MGIFDFLKGLFNRNKEDNGLTDAELKWNKMWDMWAMQDAASPYSELMTYQAEVNNGGHAQFFDNVSNISDIEEELDAILSVLMPPLYDNLLNAKEAFVNENNALSEDEIDAIYDKCDSVFYENEDLINIMLQNYASTIVL